MHRYTLAVRRRFHRMVNDIRIRYLAIQVARHSPNTTAQPVLFFNASSRLSGLSLNSAFSLLTSWGLRLAGIPVHHFVCHSGMTRCIHGTKPDEPQKTPPCRECIRQSKVNFRSADVTWFRYQPEQALERALDGLSVEEMKAVVWEGVPLGALVLPSVRWVLRRYHLQEDKRTQFFYRQYILSAWSIARSFKDLLSRIHPSAVVVFNGMVYPEAVVRWIARSQGIRVITHEVNLQPFSAYFTDREATFRTVQFDPAQELTEEQSAQLEAYLEKRFRGQFKMAGVTFWKEMHSLGDELEAKIGRFQQVVPVFTNVIFDTTQDHANTVFQHMFDWLDTILGMIRSHPETLFVIRAHPDEWRPGKTSQESVADWVRQNQVDKLDNVYFIPPDQYISSYELIRRGKFIFVYTSTIGLEAALMGAVVLCGGNARYNQIPVAFFEKNPADFVNKAEQLLTEKEVFLPAEYRSNARKYLFAELFQYALPFDRFLGEDGFWQGYTRLKPFSWQDLLPEKSKTMKVLIDGILYQKPFRMD